MTIAVWIQKTRHLFAQASSSTPRLDAELLLADHLGRDRSWLVAHADDEINAHSLAVLDTNVQRRINKEPLAYIREKQEFYGREFYVNKTVLVPRPESEMIIEIFKGLPLSETAAVADVGCGSGVLGITALLEKPGISLHFLDSDERVFSVVEKNAKTYGLKDPYCHRGNLLEAYPAHYDVILCNLPYVPDNYPINDSARHEPRTALFSGEDGLTHYSDLFHQLDVGPATTQYIIAEALPEQHQAITSLAKQSHYRLVTQRDFILLLEQIV